VKKDQRIIIVGGGLSGLTLSYLLSKQKIFATILEASNRLGGRIKTIKGENDTPLELGATWFSDMHHNLISLLNELELNKYPQYTKGKSLFQTKSLLPPQEFYVAETDAPSYRIVNGTQKLIDTLINKINPNQIKLKTKVTTITQNDNELIVESNKGDVFMADKVILCLPPQLVGSTINFLPKLPGNTKSILPMVQTWMAGSIKFVLEYQNPFWRKKGYSGMLYSHVGIVSEMYDHTNFEENKFGFTGFLNASASKYPKVIRKEYVLKQLEELLGEEASKPLTYYEKVWTDEYILDSNDVIPVPHKNNGHPLLQQSYMNGNLLFSGTETTPEFSGYMEGAVISAKNTYEKIV
jgi:monoamine oxidase